MGVEIFITTDVDAAAAEWTAQNRLGGTVLEIGPSAIGEISLPDGSPPLNYGNGPYYIIISTSDQTVASKNILTV